MSDIPNPDYSDLGEHGGEQQQAEDAVRAVVSWYSRKLARERRAVVPDEERVEALKAAQQAAMEDQRRLETAEPEEVARIAAVYAARLKELSGS